MATRTLRKELRRPDEFVSLTNRAAQYARDHGRIVAWIGGAALLAVLGTIAMASFRHTRWEQANTQLARAMSLFTEKKIPEAAAAFEAFTKEPSNPGEFTAIARLYTAQAALREREFAKATAGFSEVAGGLHGFLHQSALLNEAFALEGSGQFQEAAQRFRRAVEIGGPYTPIAVFGEARNLDTAGERAKARDAYRKYVADYPDAPEVAVAEARMAALGE